MIVLQTFDARVADVDAGTGDDLLHLGLRFAAETSKRVMRADFSPWAQIYAGRAEGKSRAESTQPAPAQAALCTAMACASRVESHDVIDDCRSPSPSCALM